MSQLRRILARCWRTGRDSRGKGGNGQDRGFTRGSLLGCNPLFVPPAIRGQLLNLTRHASLPNFVAPATKFGTTDSPLHKKICSHSRASLKRFCEKSSSY